MEPMTDEERQWMLDYLERVAAEVEEEEAKAKRRRLVLVEDKE